MPENSICHEIDTGKHYYLANGEWHQLPARGGGEGLPDNFPAEGSANANKFLGFDANGDYTAKDAPSGGGAEKFVVTLTEDDGTWTADKTVAEIAAADEAGQIVVAKYPLDGTLMDVPLLIVETFSDDGVEMSIASFATIFEGAHNTLTSITVNAQGADEDVWGVKATNIEIPTNAPLIVTLTADGSTGNFVGNKTNKEVYDAFTAGGAVILSASVGSSAFKLAVQYATYDGTDYEFAFIGSDAVKNTVSGGANDYVTASLG